MATREADALNPAALDHGRQRAGIPLPAVVAPWKALTLYIGVPVAFCLYASLNNWKLLEQVGFWMTLGFYSAHMAIPWTVTAFLTAAAWKLLGPWRPGLALITLVGSMAGCLATLPYVNWITEFMETRYAIRTTVGGLPVGEPGSPWGRIFGSMLRTYLIWLGVNYVFDRFLGYPRYRYTSLLQAPSAGRHDSRSDGAAVPAAVPATQPISGDTLPVFMSRLAKPACLSDLLAIHAEQHYIKVITTAGQELVLYRMSDAVRQLPDNLGLQVHRSWWVSRQAIQEVMVSGKKMSIRLSNGLVVPVSAPYQALTRRLATDR